MPQPRPAVPSASPTSTKPVGAVVAEKRVATAFAIDPVQVLIAVAVKVERGRAAAFGLGDIALFQAATRVDAGQAEFSGHIDEGRKRLGCGAARPWDAEATGYQSRAPQSQCFSWLLQCGSPTRQRCFSTPSMSSSIPKPGPSGSTMQLSLHPQWLGDNLIPPRNAGDKLHRSHIRYRGHQMCSRDDADRAFGIVRRDGNVKGVGNGRNFAHPQ